MRRASSPCPDDSWLNARPLALRVPQGEFGLRPRELPCGCWSGAQPPPFESLRDGSGLPAANAELVHEVGGDLVCESLEVFDIGKIGADEVVALAVGAQAQCGLVADLREVDEDALGGQLDVAQALL